MKLVDKFQIIYPQSFLVFFSFSKADVSPLVNTARRIIAEEWLDKEGMAWDRVQGAYTMDDGEVVSEDSFVVQVHTPDEVRTISDKAFAFEQESILVVNQMQGAFLVTKLKDHTYHQEEIGKLCEITADEIGDYENYTVDRNGSINQYYVVK